MATPDPAAPEPMSNMMREGLSRSFGDEYTFDPGWVTSGWTPSTSLNIDLEGEDKIIYIFDGPAKQVLFLTDGYQGGIEMTPIQRAVLIARLRGWADQIEGEDR